MDLKNKKDENISTILLKYKFGKKDYFINIFGLVDNYFYI